VYSGACHQITGSSCTLLSKFYTKWLFLTEIRDLSCDSQLPRGQAVNYTDTLCRNQLFGCTCQGHRNPQKLRSKVQFGFCKENRQTVKGTEISAAAIPKGFPGKARAGAVSVATAHPAAYARICDKPELEGTLNLASGWLADRAQGG
jgi:hypothetical protein